MFEVDQIGKIEQEVEKVLQKERQLYSNYYEIIEKYLETNKDDLLLGGTTGIDLLFHRSRSLEDYTYDLYSENIFRHTNDLTNELAPICDKSNHYILLLTKIPDRTYEIQINNRSMVRLQTLVGRNNMELIKPISEKSYQGYKINILSPEVYLIDTYRTLSSPNRVADWESTLRDETKLFQLMKHRIKGGKDENKTQGGKDENKTQGGKDERKEEQKLSQEEHIRVEQELLMNYIDKNPNIILIGEHALRVINDHDKFVNGQFVMSSRVLHIIGNAEEAKEACQKLFPKNKTSSTTKKVPILGDSRLERTSIKIDEKEVMYVYNSAKYDLIPHFKLKQKSSGGGQSSQIQIGSPFVIMRFLFIDVWMIRFIQTLKLIDENFANKRIKNIVDMMLSLRSKLQDENINIQTMSTISPQSNTEQPYQLATNIKDEYFQPGIMGLLAGDYYGDYVSEYKAVRLELQSVTTKYYPYYPQQYYRQHNQYRDITKKSRGENDKEKDAN